MNILKRLSLLLLVSVTALSLYAQGGKSELRTVHGTVVDKQESPVDSAVVYLKNGRTQDIKTYISDNAGHFRFSGLDTNIDYEVHAERDGMSSSARSISSFDTRKDIDATLKLDRKKSDK